MNNNLRLFSDVASVSRTARITLTNDKLLNDSGSVVGWPKLAPWLINRDLSERAAKQLVLIELEAESPRPDIIRRLVSYLSYSAKEQTMAKVEKLLEGGADE